MIEVKSFYTNWHETTKENARSYIKGLLVGMTNMPKDEIPAYIEENHLRGISFEELMKEDDE